MTQGHRSLPQALPETERVIRTEETPAIVEAAFQHRGVLVRVDILERLECGVWRMIKVKSTTRLKDQHIRDAALRI